MVAAAFVAIFTLFALFLAGQFVRALIVPFILIATLVYVVYLTGLFGSHMDAEKSRPSVSQRAASP